MADTEPTKKSTTKKSTPKKTTAKKSTAKKSTAKGSTAKGTTAGGTTRTRATAPRTEASRGSARSEGRSSGQQVVAEAVRQFSEMAGKQVEGVTGLQRSDEGWQVELDVLELRRIPETTDVLASYEVTVGSSGDVEGYRRTHRYVRGQAEDST